MFILDEADEMLSRGFKDQIYDVFRTLNENIQVCEEHPCLGCTSCTYEYLPTSTTGGGAVA